MANRNATLYIRITKNGKSSFCKPVYQSKGRLKPQYAMVNGEPEHHKEGVYYVRFGADGGKQQYALAGKDPRCLGQAGGKETMAAGPGTAGRSSNACLLETADKL